MQRIFAEQLPIIHFAAPRVYVATSSRVLNATPALLRPTILWNPDPLAVRRPRRVRQLRRGVLRYLARRLVFALLLVFVVSSGALLLTRLAPGDFASDLFGAGASPETIARERARYGLDRPVLGAVRRAGCARAVRLDLGTSLMYRPAGRRTRPAAGGQHGAAGR